MSQSSLQAFKKIDLHTHLEGAIFPDTFRDIVREFNLQVPKELMDNLEGKLQYLGGGTLLEFLKPFDYIQELFVNYDVISSLTERVIEHLSHDNLAYLELRFSPYYMSGAVGLDPGSICDAVIEGKNRASERLKLPVNLILISERQKNLELGEEVVNLAKNRIDKGIVGVDLANDEYNYPPLPFAEVFQRAKSEGLKVTIHAGEAGASDEVKANNVKVAVENLGADRIGHGVAIIKSPEVYALIRDLGIHIESCPTSNVQTGSVKSIQEHPVATFLRDGINVGVNQDDPGISNISLTSEHELLQRIHGFTAADLLKLTLNALDAAFIGSEQREALRNEILASYEGA